MQYFLIEGARQVGKTGTLIRLKKYLIESCGFTEVVCIPKKPNDFYALLTRDRFSVCINSPSDNPVKIDEGFAFYTEHKPNLLISSCREDKKLYDYFFERFGITESDNVIELPLAKITRRNKQKSERSLKWYHEKIDKLVLALLKSEFGVLLTKNDSGKRNE